MLSSGINSTAFALAFGVFFVVQSLLSYYHGFFQGYLDAVLGPGVLAALASILVTFIFGALYGLFIAVVYNHFSKRN